jgi:prevent-host-death family protein
MARQWQLQDAKNRLSRLVDEAAKGEPQIITRRGRAAAVVVSPEQFRRLSRGGKGLVAFLRSSPLVGIPLDDLRSDEPAREVDL